MKRILIFLLLYTSLFGQLNKDRYSVFDRPIEKEAVDYKDRLASSSVTLTPPQFFEANEAIQVLKILRMWDGTKALNCSDWSVKKDGSNYVSTFYNVAYKESANLIGVFNFTSGWSTTGTVSVNNSNTFTTGGNGGIYKSFMTANKKYTVSAKGTTASTRIDVYQRDDTGNAQIVGQINPTTSSFTFTAIYNNIYLRNTGAGATTISQLDLYEVLNPDLEQSTGSAQPLYVANVINGRSVIRFDGTSDYLKTALTTWAQPLTVMMAVRQKSWAEYSTLFDGYTSTSMALYQRTTSPTIRMSTGGTILDNSNLTLNSMSLVTAVYNAGSSSIQVNNTTKVSGSLGSAVNPLGFTVGALPNGGSPSNIEVGLILIYQGTLTPEQEAGWKAYVNGKYRLY